MERQIMPEEVMGGETQRNKAYNEIKNRFDNFGFKLTMAEAVKIREIIDQCIQDKNNISNQLDKDFYNIVLEAEARFFHVMYSLDLLNEVYGHVPGVELSVLNEGDENINDPDIINKKYIKFLNKVRGMRELQELI